MVCVIGISVWHLMPVESTPELNLPSVTVRYYWGSTSPEIMEMEITRKVERGANRLRDVIDIRSITQEGQSAVTITFRKNAPVDYRVLELREYLFGLDENLPENIAPPLITQQVPEELEDQQTFMVYTLNGERPPRELLKYARNNIRPKLLSIDGLAGIALQGVQDPALVIEFDITMVDKYQLSPQKILLQVREQLSWRSAGFVEEGISRYSLIIPPNFNSIVDIAALKVKLPNSQKQLKLDDFASISIQEFPAKTIKRINGDPALTIEFLKGSGADAFRLAENVLEEMKEIEIQLPEELSLMLTLDSTEELRQQFDDLQMQAILSGILVFLVVILFIRKLRAPFIIMGSVLFSVLLSLIILYLFGYSLNIITLAGITVALGMLIDNAVVVFEHLNPRLPSEKEDRIHHILKQIGKSVVPVLGSTFTTIGIFIPLLFALDELRIFLVPLAVALTVTLICSVIIAFTWIPYALIWLTPLFEKQSKQIFSFGWVNRFLMKSFLVKSKLRWVLPVLLIGVIGIPLFAIEEPEWSEDKHTLWPEFTRHYFENRTEIDKWLGGITKKFVEETYFGSPWSRNNQESIYVYIRSPQGTPLSEIDKIVKNYEKIVKPYAPAFSYYEANISEYYGAYMRFIVDPDYLTQPEPYYFYGEAMYLGARTGNFATSVSGLNIPGISIGFGGGSSNHTIHLVGYSYDELLNLAKDLERRLKASRRVREVDINSSYYTRRDDFKQYILRLNEQRILANNLSRQEVISSLMLDLNPENTVGKVEFGGQEMYLIGRSERQKMFEEDLVNRIRRIDNVNFNMHTVGEIVKEGTLNEIRRTNQSYERAISVNYLGNYRMGREFIEQVIEETPVPVGANINFGFGYFGFENNESNRNVIFIALFSLLSVWMIVSALLESIKYSVFVIIAVPFSLIGIMLGSLANDMSFDRGAIAGSLLCIGVVVNNAILIYHQKQLENDAGIIGLRSWMHVYRKRLRAILITTATTITGLLPMMFFGNNEFWENLAIIVTWGLTASTILLIVFSGLRVKME